MAKKEEIKKEEPKKVEVVEVKKDVINDPSKVIAG